MKSTHTELCEAFEEFKTVTKRTEESMQIADKLDEIKSLIYDRIEEDIPGAEMNAKKVTLVPKSEESIPDAIRDDIVFIRGMIPKLQDKGNVYKPLKTEEK